MSALNHAAFNEWCTAVPDWADRIKSGRSLVPELPLHDAYAEKALAIFKELRNPDLDGFPTFGETCDVWVFDLVRVIFGSFDPEIKKRYLREFFVMIPKKNGKTAIAAAIIVTACVLNMSPEAQFILVAPSIELARNAFDCAAGIIKRTARITKVFSEPRESTRTIFNLNKRIPSKIMIKAADGDIITGLKNATVLIDETHVFATKPAAKGLFVEIRGALSHPSNKHFLLQITTQSKKPPVGVFRSEVTTARRVRDGKIKKPMLALLYELPTELVKDGGWKDEDTWALVNPHLGRSVDWDFLRDAVQTAEDEGAESLALVASQHFNVEIGTAQGDDGWRAQAYWDGAGEETLTLDELIERSEVITLGVDGGGDDDLCGAVVLGKEKDTGVYLAWCRAWCQPEVLKLRKSIAPSLETFKKDGDLVICSQPFEHVDQVVELTCKLKATGKMPEEFAVGLDIAGLPELLTALNLEGLEEPFITSVPQGWRLQSAVKSLPLRLKARLMLHGAQPIFAWSIGNARVEVRRSNSYIEKELAGAAKIDVVIGLLNASELMFRNPVPSGRGLDDFLANPVKVI
ncbi:terminase large subunit domain-containing protein [Pacificoceanicola onchidii]|uniref:terminase large subunit domain-containing protein n=1 Tax=Pacificoceanicola onchidii TaxID=2562685 RepID=UPI0010A4A9CA|nr:terminase large subunit [Pacificoceanicola onchidii]